MKPTTSFDSFAESWDDRVGNKGIVATQETVNAIFKLIGTLKNKVIYDIACGNGFLARKFIKAGAKKVYASDISPKLIEIAKNKYNSERIEYSIREATNFKEISKNYFDVAVINAGIFYIKNIDKLFAGIYKILKSNGIVVFSVMHPLLPVSREVIGMMSQKVAIKELKNYLRGFTSITKKKHKLDNQVQDIIYLNYNKPLNYYLNLCGKNNLLTKEIIEPKTKTMFNNKIKKTSIPGSIIIKAVKI